GRASDARVNNGVRSAEFPKAAPEEVTTPRPSAGSMSYLRAKRWLDLVGASLGLMLLSPVCILVGLAIRLTGRGPVFYGQTRVGQFGKPFRMWKCRSMVPDADKIGAPLTRENDPRITPVGRWLRRTKLDELPQLWNVLKGEMSLVGPRPELPKFVRDYSPQQREILSQKPGMTDLASQLFRDEAALLEDRADVESFYLCHLLPRKIELSRQSVRTPSIATDLWIIFRTLCPDCLSVMVLYAISLTVCV